MINLSFSSYGMQVIQEGVVSQGSLVILALRG